MKRNSEEFFFQLFLQLEEQGDSDDEENITLCSSIADDDDDEEVSIGIKAMYSRFFAPFFCVLSSDGWFGVLILLVDTDKRRACRPYLRGAGHMLMIPVSTS